MLRSLGRLIVGCAAAIGALLASQFPEFAQQYRQRLGGALQEVQAVVEDFDQTATRNRLSRDQALQRLSESGDAFLQDQGQHAKTTIARLENLSDQRARFESAPPLMRPVVMLSRPDPRIVEGAWQDYEPAVPTTPTGFVWAAIGFFAAGGVVSLVRQLGGIVRRNMRRSRSAQLVSDDGSL